VQLAPDAIFGLRHQREDGKAARAYFFLEIDRGTMTIVPSERVRDCEAFPYRATILRKLYAYADSYRLEIHKAQFAIGLPRVLFLTRNAARAAAIQKAATEFVIKPLKLSTGILLFGVLNATHEPLAPVYKDAIGQAVPLVQPL